MKDEGVKLGQRERIGRQVADREERKVRKELEEKVRELTQNKNGL